MTRHVIVIGGGVAGLGAAYKLRRAAEEGYDVTFTLLERDDRVGGKLHTILATDPESGGRYVVDGGSDSFLTDKPAVHRVARQLGILGDETGTLDENKGTFIVKDGRLVELPDGIMMFAPTKIAPMATTALYSPAGKARMAMDLVIPPKRVPHGELNDETLESFVVRRMGRECLERLAEPLVGGVNGSDPREMSLAATYPNLLEMEQQHGSLIRGFLAQRKRIEEMRRDHPPSPGAPKRTFFSSFRDGLQYLTDRMADAAGRDGIRTGAVVSSLRKAADGSWQVTLDSGETVTGDAVVVATETWAAERLLGGVDARSAQLLRLIPCSSSATVVVALHGEDCPFDRGWHGILSPAVERLPVTGVSLVSSKWPDRAPDGRVLLRGFVGGPRDQAVLGRSDEELVALTLRELSDLLGLRPDADPLYSRVFRWDKGMPQYTLGHLGRVAELEERCAALGGIRLAGGGYHGVGVPNCLDTGESAVRELLGEWGVTFLEDTKEQPRTH